MSDATSTLPAGDARPSGTNTPVDRSPTIVAQAISVAGAALLVDAVVETMWSGSPVRWWPIGAAALYLVVSFATWRRRIGWQQRLGVLGVMVFGLLAATAWRPEGLIDGVRVLRQPTAIVLSGATVVGLLMTAVVLLRASAIPLAARLVAVLIAMYGLAAFAFGAWQATTYPSLFNGASLWQTAPRWLQGSVVGGLVALPIGLLVSLAGGLRRGERAWRPQQIIALGLAVVMVASGFINAAGVGGGGITLATATAPAAGSGSSADPGPPAAPDAAALAAVRDASQRILGSTPKSAFDVGQKAAELGADVNSLFVFVRDSIRHEVYAGVLRGARGTLISHAANAWDKSVLLAALLRHHGRDVRFARGHLAPDRAIALVTKMFKQAGQPAPAPAFDLPASVVGQSRDLVARIEARWRSARSDLMGALDRGGVTLGESAPVTEAMLAEEAADHVWVEYRDGDRWVPLDPSAAAQPGETLTTATETFPQIPDALYHHVTFRVKVERRQSQKLEERDVFIWSSTAAELHGTSVLFAHQVGQTPLGRWRATPVLVVDQQPYAALSFTDAGWEQASKPADALVGEASRQVQGVGRITELFGGAPTPQAQPAASSSELTRVCLDVEFTDSSGRSDTVRREILDRIGPAARARGAAGAALAPLAIASDMPIALAGLHSCAVTAGSLDARLTLNRLSPSLAVLDDALALPKTTGAGSVKMSPDDQARLARVLRGLPTVLGAAAQTIHVLSQRFVERVQVAGTRPVFYEATPRLAIVSFEPGAAGLTVDLRRDVLRVAGGADGGDGLVRANLARGVLDGVIEDAVLEPAIGYAPKAGLASTAGILGRVRADGARVVVVRDARSLEASGASEAARARIASALLHGQIVVAPERAAPIAGASRFAWWTVDPATGETVGVVDNGLHGVQAIPERGAIMEAELGLAKTAAAADPLAATQAVASSAGPSIPLGIAYLGMVISAVSATVGAIMACQVFGCQ